MTREEAIKEIKSWDFLEGKELEAIGTLIPELKESAEDERIYKEIMEFFKMNEKMCVINNHYPKWIAWLEKQKENLEKQKEQKQEWSEEDEEMIKMILGDLEWERRNTTVDKDIRLYDEKIAWLKSLRPQPHWKPSEEQLRYLKKVYESYDFCDGERNALESLYEQLEKLM